MWCIMSLMVVAASCMVRPHTIYDRVVFAMSLVERRMVLSKLFEQSDVPVKLRPAKATTMGQLKLMFRHASHVSHPEILPYSSVHRQTMKGNEVAALLFVLDDLEETRRLAFRWPRNTKNGVVYAAHAGFVTLPRAVANRIFSLLRGKRCCEGKKGDGS